MLLAGSPEDIAALEQTFTPEQKLLMDIVDRIDIEKQPLSDLVEAMHRHAVARVIFAAGHSQLNRVEEAIGACEVEGVPAWLVADFIRTSIAKADVDAFGGRPMLVFRSTPDVSWNLFIKDVIDRVGAFIALVVLALPMGIVALTIRITSHGPIIFRQQRAGKHGKPFVMYKFRSMSNDAEMRRAELEPFNQMHGPVFKVEADPRITPFGRWLRRTSFDELPQLVNVLMGDMSLVGPRPLPLYEVEKFENTAQRRRLSVKPGLTCLWQISGRNQVKDFQRLGEARSRLYRSLVARSRFQNSVTHRAGRADGSRCEIAAIFGPLYLYIETGRRKPEDRRQTRTSANLSLACEYSDFRRFLIGGSSRHDALDIFGQNVDL